VGISSRVTHMESMLLTGDDDGSVKLWDLRTRACVQCWSENEDFISDFAIAEDKNIALATRSLMLVCTCAIKFTVAMVHFLCYT